MDFTLLAREQLTFMRVGIMVGLCLFGCYLANLKTQIVAGVLALHLLLVLYLYFSHRPVLTPLDIETRRILTLADRFQAHGIDVEDVAKELQESKNPRQRAGRFVAACVNAARAEYGLVTECEANRLMIRKFIRDKMRKQGMRESHIAFHCDRAVTIYFIPLDSDIAEGRRRNGLIGGHQRSEHQKAWTKSPFGDRSIA